MSGSVVAPGGFGAAGRTAARLARQVELALGECDLTLAQYRILALLATSPEGPSKLAQKLAVRAPSVTTVVEGLTQRGYVDRSHLDGEDRRRISHDLTDQGRAMLDAADEVVGRRFAAIVGELGDEEQVRRAMDGLVLFGVALTSYRERRDAEQRLAKAGQGR